jgi:general secretion pathway protein L
MDVMLGVVGGLLPANTTPTAVEYAAGELRLKGLTLKPVAVSSISFMLKPKGYMANVEGDALVVKQVSEP